MAEFWQDMLLPWLPFYMRLRCRQLSRRHYAMDPTPPSPPAWVKEMRVNHTRAWFIALGLAVGFPATPPVYDMTRFAASNDLLLIGAASYVPAYRWSTHPRSMEGTRVAIDIGSELAPRFTASRRTTRKHVTWHLPLKWLVPVPFPLETFPVPLRIHTTADDFFVQLEAACTKYAQDSRV